MSTTPLFDAVVARFAPTAAHSREVHASWLALLAPLRTALVAGQISDADAAEGLDLACRLVREDVPVDVGLQTMVSHALTHKGKPTS